RSPRGGGFPWRRRLWIGNQMSRYKNNQTVAIKVNKSDPGILQQAKLEIFVLEQLRRLDPDRCNIVEWNGYFLDGERICLNFELLDQSLWDYIRDRNNQAQKFNCSFQNSVEFPQKGHLNTSANPSSSEDDLEITEGTILGDHHVVEAFLGEGGFGLVTRCRDTKNNQTVAIKVNKSDPGILQQAKLEIFVLEQLRRLDPDRCNIVEWNGYFLDGERICLNFELLDQSLWDYIGDRNNQGLPITELRPILHQLANALFHLGSVGIVHADLKPGNIMVVNRHESPIKVKLIDFGLAFPASALIPGYRVGTVGYCAPEVMLGLPYHEAIDMWSLGLVAVELATGLPLYPGEDYYDVLKFIIETQEQFQYETGPENGQPLFVRLIKEMLALRANQRITPSEVLKHPFFDPDLSRRTPRHRYE
uniref:Protein kinase domain-containing protein n=1 Tax=Oreochromis niloticus TaxID=8128 RepID=A0A669EYG2_ORENI